MLNSTLDFGNVHPELIALFKHTLTPLLDKGVELGREFGHAVAQIVETEIDAWKRVRDRRVNKGRSLAASARRKGWLK